MEIKFEINDTQAKALEEISPYIVNPQTGKPMPPDEYAKALFIRAIIDGKQKLIAKDLS